MYCSIIEFSIKILETMIIWINSNYILNIRMIYEKKKVKARLQMRMARGIFVAGDFVGNPQVLHIRCKLLFLFHEYTMVPTWLIIKTSSHLRISRRRLPLPFSTIFSTHNFPIFEYLGKRRFEAHNNASSSKIPPLSLAFISLSR